MYDGFFSRNVIYTIYIYQLECICQRNHKECSTRTCADDCYYCWKGPDSSHLYDHGSMDVITTPIVRQSVNHKTSFKWLTNNRIITLKNIKHITINQKGMLQYKMNFCIPFYFIGVAIVENVMPKLDFNAHETRIYTLRFHFSSLSDIFDSSITFKWCIMPSYKSKAMIKVTKWKSCAMQTVTKNWLYPQTSDTSLTSWRQPFCNAFWHGNQDDGDVTSYCAVITI